MVGSEFAISNSNNRYSPLQKGYNIFLVLYTVLFLSDHSLPGYYLGPWTGRLEILTGMVLLILTFIKFVRADRSVKKKWLKSYTLIIMYLVVRVLTFVRLGFDYSTARTIFFEGVYLLTLSEYITDSGVIKRYVVRITVYWTLILNILNVLFYKILMKQGSLSAFSQAMVKYTFLERERYYPSSTMYVNPNTFGIMTGISVIFLLIMLRDSSLSQKTRYLAFGAYLIFSIYCLSLAECNTANLALAVILVLAVINLIVKKGNAKRIETIVIFILILAINAGTIVFIYNHTDQGLFSIKDNKYENTLNTLGSDRYFILKSGFMSQKGSLVLGCGSLKNEVNTRTKYALGQYDKLSPEQKEANTMVFKFKDEKLGPHNGYASMIFCTGYIGAALFFLILFMKMKKSGVLKQGYWYMVVIYVLIINNFESMFILNKYVLCLYLLMILSMRNEDNKREV